MIRPFKPALGGFRFDKFSKWIEYKPLVSGTTKQVAELPNSIITDPGSMFTANDLCNFCDDRGIVVKYVSVAHPRANR
jgi:hypothetical protein